MALEQAQFYGMSGHAGVYPEVPARLTGHKFLHHYFHLVLLAAPMCLAGSWITLKLFHRAAGISGMQRIGWHILTAVAAGAVPPSAERRPSENAETPPVRTAVTG